MQENCSCPSNTSEKNPDRLSTTDSIRLLRISLKIDQRLALALTREIGEFQSDGAPIVLYWLSRCEQSQKHAIQSQAHAPVACLLSFLFFSEERHYTLSLSSSIILFASIVNTEVCFEQLAPFYLPKAAKYECCPDHLQHSRAS